MYETGNCPGQNRASADQYANCYTVPDKPTHEHIPANGHLYITPNSHFHAF